MQGPEDINMDEIKGQLSRLLGLDMSEVQLVAQEGGAPGTLLSVSAFDHNQTQRRLILKRQENDAALRLYRQYLEPFQLNSPRVYGYVDIDAQPFLVMDRVNHTPARWDDGDNYLKAVAWLVKKDQITWEHIARVRSLDCFEKMKYSGVDYCLANFERWRKNSPDDQQAQQVWRCVNANQVRITETISALDETGVQTVVHGDLQMGNVLFGEGEAEGQLFVIDWTEPHIGSVAQDLADLYDNAPHEVKAELVKTYRQQIDFPEFEAVFAKARILRDIGYLSWMAWMINDGHGEEIAQAELNRVASSLISSIPSA